MQSLKLYKVLIGCKPKGRQTEQHDVFFGIAENLQSLIPQLKAFWPEAANTMHVDAYRIIKYVDGYEVMILPKNTKKKSEAQLYFINLGGYKPNEFEEFHYKMVVAATIKAIAIQQSKSTTFYKHTGFAKATSHVDDKYGIDVDDIMDIGEILHKDLKNKYTIVLKKVTKPFVEDSMHLGYFKMSKIENGTILTY